MYFMLALNGSELRDGSVANGLPLADHGGTMARSTRTRPDRPVQNPGSMLENSELRMVALSRDILDKLSLIARLSAKENPDEERIERLYAEVRDLEFQRRNLEGPLVGQRAYQAHPPITAWPPAASVA